MKIVKTSQYENKIPVQKLVQDWSKLQLGSVSITGSRSNMSITFNGKQINVRSLLDKAVSLIRPELIQHGVKEIDTSPLPPNIQGLAVSSEPGKIHVDVEKIAKKFETSPQPPTVQIDGTSVDTDAEDHLASMLTQELLATIGHESQHQNDFRNQFVQYQKNPQQFKNGPAFDKVQEAPGPIYENKIRQRFKNTANKKLLFSLK